MKKLIALFIILSMALCLFSCGGGDNEVIDDRDEEEIAKDNENENEEEEEENEETDSDESFTDEEEEDTTDDAPSTPDNDDSIHEDEDTESEEEETAPSGPVFENDCLTLYKDWSKARITKLHKDKVGRLYIETADGFYHFSDTEMENNYLDKEDIDQWVFSEFAYEGFYYTDANGYIHLGEYLAHGIKGDILYAFDSFSGDFVVYSFDETDGHLYKSTFKDTGMMIDDNVIITFEEQEQNGYSFTTLGYYETAEYIRVLPAKGSYVSGPDVLIKVNGKTYIESLSIIVADQVSLTTNYALTEVEANNFLDYVSYETAYYKDDVADQLFYTYDDDEFVIYLPDGHTVDEITYFNRGVTDMLIFDNGDVYTWDGQASILGETPEKNEVLTSVSAEIDEAIYCNGTYYVLMSDGCIYKAIV